ncbi:MAG TPA: uracil-DNA glycosylase family protein [Ohtaekwangia sp.]|uniref:uracil-DNA glycosylase family protein n=1 Tax=Ohtaekwangia sp. TaxID=2066019 RepID=UPI002F93DB22
MELVEIHGGGLDKNPEYFLVFHRVVEGNITLDKDWKGLRVPIIGKTGAWKMLYNLELINRSLYDFTVQVQHNGWTTENVSAIYKQAAHTGLYITAFVKSLAEINTVVIDKYRAVLLNEIDRVQPKRIIVFGGEASRYVFRRQEFRAFSKTTLMANRKSFTVYIVPYPVARARRLLASTIHFLRQLKGDH